MEYEILKTERSELEVRRDILNCAVKGIRMKLEEYRKQITDTNLEIREYNKQINKLIEREADEQFKSLCNDGFSIDDKRLYQLIHNRIQVYMNKTDVLTVYDFIAYSLVRGKPWDYGMTKDNNGYYLNNEPKNVIATRVNSVFFNVVISSYINVCDFTSDDKELRIKANILRSKIRDHYEPMIFKLTNRIHT